MTPDDMEALRAKAQRAAEVLGDAGWVFDEFIKAETESMLATDDNQADARERHYRLIRAAAEVKARLIVTAQSYNVEATLADRRTQQR